MPILRKIHPRLLASSGKKTNVKIRIQPMSLINSLLIIFLYFLGAGLCSQNYTGIYKSILNIT
jgi:hypothetical protein